MRVLYLFLLLSVGIVALPTDAQAQTLQQKVAKRVKESKPKHKTENASNSASTGAQAAAMSTQQSNMAVEQQQAAAKQMQATDYTQQLKNTQSVRPTTQQTGPVLRPMTTYSTQQNPRQATDTQNTAREQKEGSGKKNGVNPIGGGGFNIEGGNNHRPTMADAIEFKKEPSSKPLNQAIEEAKAAGVKLSMISFVRADGLGKTKEKHVKDFKLKTDQLGSITDCAAAINYYNNNHDMASKDFIVYEAVKVNEGLYTIRIVPKLQ